MTILINKKVEKYFQNKQKTVVIMKVVKNKEKECYENNKKRLQEQAKDIEMNCGRKRHRNMLEFADILINNSNNSNMLINIVQKMIFLDKKIYQQ